MVNKMFLIGEIARLFQMDIRTLRYYDEIGLLNPAFTDEGTGYRYYAIHQFERLNTILYLKALNIPLKEIRRFLDGRDIGHILALLKEQQRRTEQKILEFQQIQQKINDRIGQIEAAANVEELYQIRELELPARRIVMLKQKIHRNDNLEIPIRTLENRSRMKSSIFLGQVGLMISVNSLLQRKWDEYDALFMFVEPDPSVDGEIMLLPQRHYLTVRFAGTHAEAAPLYRKLLDYAEENGHTLGEDALEITYIDYGLTQDSSRFVTEIQLPVNNH